METLRVKMKLKKKKDSLRNSVFTEVDRSLALATPAAVEDTSPGSDGANHGG